MRMKCNRPLKNVQIRVSGKFYLDLDKGRKKMQSKLGRPLGTIPYTEYLATKGRRRKFYV